MAGTHSYRKSATLENVEKRRTCDVNVIFKNTVNLAYLHEIADIYC